MGNSFKKYVFDLSADGGVGVGQGDRGENSQGS